MTRNLSHIFCRYDLTLAYVVHEMNSFFSGVLFCMKFCFFIKNSCSLPPMLQHGTKTNLSWLCMEIYMRSERNR